ncbi:MAG: exopolysaccharide biosynthesis polyprenyl glycosylphosphotransferase [Spirochaetales bacterium]|nr:exopolysaccharide biosynthesis polyprenyl glycosylphosphotransferase [Spirochaetales bacterium]
MKRIHLWPNALMDAVLFTLSLFITLKLRAFSSLLIFTKALDYNLNYHQVVIFLTALPIYILTLYLIGIYDLQISITRVQVFLRSLLAGLVVFFWILVVSYLIQARTMPRSLIFLFLIIDIILFNFQRGIFLRKLKKVEVKVMIAGNPQENHKLISTIKGFNSFRIKVEGIITPKGNEGHHEGFPVLGNYQEVDRLINEKQADALFIASHSSEEKEKLLQHIQYSTYGSTRLYATPSNYEILLSSPQYIRIGDIPLIRMNKSNQNLFFFKRGLDILGSLLLLIALSPLMVLVFLLVKLTSRGPAVFRQKRVGKDQRLFTIYKFRTMYQEFESKVYQAQGKKDKRITPVGLFLRKTRLDELPQLINILKGDMSFIGPRPLVESEVKEGLETNIWYKERFSILPGITGLAQVHGNYYTRAEEKMKYDLWYAFHYTPLLDVSIIFRTIKIMFLRSGT